MVYGLLEIGIMNSIWKIQENNEDLDISINDVLQSLGSNKITRAYTTIKTVMDRLVTKGVLVRYKNGKKFFYRSTIDKNEASKKALETISSQFFNGSYVRMIRFIEKECEHLLV